MPSQIKPLDLAIVVLYILGTTLLGAWFTRRQRDMRTYFVGDRDVSWWLVLISIVATETSTVTFLSVPGLAFNPEGGNLTFLQLSFGYIIGRALIAWFLVPQYLRGDLYTAYQLLRERFNSTLQRTASAIFLLTRTVADGLRLSLTGLLLQQFTGWDMQIAILVLGFVTLLYTYLGGMQAVIWTDLIQFVIYIVGAVLAGLFLIHLLPGGWQEYVTVGQQADKFKLFDVTTDWTRPYTLWAGLIGGAFFTMASHGADQMMVQRYLCSRSLGQARVALVLSGVVVLLQFALFLMIGVGLYVLRQQGLLVVSENMRNDQAFGAFIVHSLPTGLVGLLVAAVLASAMSTLSSSQNSSANAFVSDFYRPLRPGLKEGHYLFVSRLMTALWGLARIAVALIAIGLNSERSVIDQVLSVAGFTTGIILGLFLLGSLRRPVGSGAALLGLVAGFAAVLAVWLPTVRGETLLAWPWYAPVGTAVTVAVAWVVNWLGIGHGSSDNGSTKPGLDPAR